MERVNSLFAVLFVVFLCSLVSGSYGDCSLENGEKGAKYCHEAYEATYESNKKKIMDHPKKTGCCLSYSMGDCVTYAYIKADCSTEDKEVAAKVTDEMEEAQTRINTGADYIGSAVCGEQNRAKCGHLVEEYDKAKILIDSLNGASPFNSFITPFLAVVCSLIALVLS